MQTRFDAPSGPSPFPTLDGFVEHPFLKPRTVASREFQVQVAERALRENTLVVVPTGLGKTLIAVLVAAELLRRRRGTVLLVAPTRPLALQHAETLRRHFRDEGLVVLLSGEVAPARRGDLWGKGLLIVATPQTIRNDLARGRYDLTPLMLVIFDEAHRAVGDYAYVELGARLRLENPGARVLGLTASPGAQRERLAEVRRNLSIAAVEAREATSADVQAYVQPVDVEPRWVDLTPTLRRVTKPLHDLLVEKESKLRSWGLVRGERPYGLTKKELIMLQQTLGRSGFFAGLHAAALAHQAKLCVDYGEVYGLDALRRHFARFRSRPDLSRNEKSFLNHAKVKEVLDLLDKGIESSHPKMDALQTVLKTLAMRRPDFLAVVFTQYRDSIPSILETVGAAGFTAERFVGQADRPGSDGLSQEEQRDVLDRFRRRAFRVLVSTSVGEEGIDVPQVDCVVFYDAVPSEIRAIQRRGRTGRTVAGRVVLLLARGTADEGALKAAARKEAKMRSLVGRYA